VIYQCCEDLRRAALGRHPTLNGIDFLEVVDSDAAIPADRQRILRLRLIKPLGPVTITTDNVAISGGDRITDITVVAVTASAGSADVVVRVDRWGDFSRYTLRLVELDNGDQVPLTGFDAPLSQVDFSFKAECPTDADCAPGCDCAAAGAVAAAGAGHEIDYLTKDYQGFRQLMLDRISTLNPGWTERHTADFAVSLVELLAYVGDHLSYAQDSIATEAYLATARRRVSVRRHARLVDYRIDEGAAARILLNVRVQPGAGPVTLPATPTLTQAAPVSGQVAVPPVRFLTRNPAQAQPPPVIDPAGPEFAQAVAAGVAVFELAEPADRTLYEAHNEIRLYTWGGEQCCLPRGATTATLANDLSTLRAGDVVIFAEVKGPETGQPADADRSHRHPVRLTRVTLTSDPLAGYFGEVAAGSEPPPLPVTEIAWDPADALPFPLCISAEVSGTLITDISVAYGNIVLADHGLTIPAAEKLLPCVPKATLTRALAVTAGPCAGRADDPRRYVPPRYRPQLKHGPLTWQPRVTLTAMAGGTNLGPYDPAAPVADLVSGSLVTSPALLVTEQATAQEWTVRPDLLASDPGARDLVAEVDDEGRAVLRFGDDIYGRRPAADTVLCAHYRVGNGRAGNVAADTIRQVATSVSGIDSATNPVAGWGGREPQTLDEIRSQAPVAFRVQERAVTADDYAAAAQQHPDVRRAVATIEWTGSWRTVFVTVDRAGGRPVDATFAGQLRGFLESFRLAGHDVQVEAPTFVPLEIEMFVCVAPDRFREDVEAALLDVFTSGLRADGQPGVFHPDQLTFGQPVLLSRLYAAAQRVPGVQYAEITMFRRYGQPSTSALGSGELRLERTEIAELDNDPNFPDRGVLRITLGGGK
jgi:hypothetical protein